MSVMRHRYLADHAGRPPIANTPAEFASLSAIYARNFVRWSQARGLLDVDFATRLLTESPLAAQLFGGTGRSRRGGISDDCGFPPTISKRLFANLKQCASTPFEAPVLGEGSVRTNVERLSSQLGLTTAEAAVLCLAITLDCSMGLTAMMEVVSVSRLEDMVGFVAGLTTVNREEIRVALGPSALLRRSGLVTLESPIPHHGTLSVDTRITGSVLEGCVDAEKTLRRFLREEPATSLGLADYGTFRSSLETVVRLLEGWKANREKGVNLLFYGPTGVGKTEAARLVAREASAAAYLAAGDPEANGPASPRLRLASLGMGNILLAKSAAVLVFDEMEDIVPSPLRDPPQEDGSLSKLWLNRFLENNEVPTIWTTNSIAFVDPAVLRRFTLVLEFPPLSERQRRQTWTKVAGELLPASQLDTLAHQHELSPAEITASVRAAKLAGQGTLDVPTLSLVLEGASRVRGQPPRRAVRAGSEYRLEAVHATRDLVALADRLSTWKPGAEAGLTLCLYGRSGTGKSEYVHYLARRMDRPLLVRNVSDLVSKWVGDTERNIASAFEAADREGGVLLFDEADTFLSDRRGAQHAWERSQANEFLQQLEACRGFVAVTTNLYKGLDPAVLRRFMFKVEFLPLRPEQRGLLWEAHLTPCLSGPLDADSRRMVEVGLRELSELVPGDFGVVARRVKVLGGRADAAALLRELAEEVTARKHDASRAIGFRESAFGSRVATGEARAVTTDDGA